MPIADWKVGDVVELGGRRGTVVFSNEEQDVRVEWADRNNFLHLIDLDRFPEAKRIEKPVMFTREQSIAIKNELARAKDAYERTRIGFCDAQRMTKDWLDEHTEK